MISQLPSTVKSFRALGVRSEVSHLAFEPSILDALPEAPAPDIDISFVGSVSADHRQRIALLEAVAKRHDLKMWGNLPASLPASSPLRRCFQGEVWGADMYQVLRRSRITLNSHIDMAGGEAGNMRLFEATGAGTFLLTDFKDNLDTLFAPDREVATWRSIDDCLAVIERTIGDDRGRAQIAQAGHARTMAQHTYRHRTSQILGFVEQLRAQSMKLPRIIRQIGKRVVMAAPIPAPPYPGLDRLSGAQRDRRGPRRQRVIDRMACRPYRDAAGARLSRPDRRHEAAASRGSTSRSRPMPSRRPGLHIRKCSRSVAAAATIRKCSPPCSLTVSATPASITPMP